MTIEQRREWVERRVRLMLTRMGLERLPEPVWGRVYDLALHANEASDTDEREQFDAELVEEVERELAYVWECRTGEVTSSRPRQPCTIRPALDARDATRVAAIREYRARLVEQGQAHMSPPAGAPKVRYQLRAGTHCNSAAILMEIPVWMDADAVGRMYHDARKGLFGGRGKGQITERKLTLFRFCLSRLALRGDAGTDRPRQGTSWLKIAEEWNLAHPEWEYGDYREVRSAYLSTKQALFAVPWPEDRTETVTLPDGSTTTYGGLALGPADTN